MLLLLFIEMQKQINISIYIKKYGNIDKVNTPFNSEYNYKSTLHYHLFGVLFLAKLTFKLCEQATNPIQTMRPSRTIVRLHKVFLDWMNLDREKQNLTTLASRLDLGATQSSPILSFSIRMMLLYMGLNLN